MLNTDGIIIDRGNQPLLKLLAVGDCLPGGRTEKYFILGKSEYVLGNTKDLFSEADFTLFNLETPMCVNGSPIQKCGPNFRVDPRTALGFKKAGFNVACLSNNHILDYGPKGLEETLKVLNEAEIFTLGAGNSYRDATKPIEFEKRGVRITFLNYAEAEFSRYKHNYSGAAPLDHDISKLAIEEAKYKSDIVIVSVHAGNEYLHFPSPWLQNIYRQFIDYGATVIIGHHPHIPQGIECYKDGLIAYSLGDFMFEYDMDVGTCGTLALEISFDKKGIILSKIYPIKKISTGEMKMLEGKERNLIIKHIGSLSRPLSNKDELKILWEQGIIRKFEKFYYKKMKEFLPRLISKGNKKTLAALFLYNMLDCRSHYEALKGTFELIYKGEYEKVKLVQDYFDVLDENLEHFNYPVRSVIYEIFDTNSATKKWFKKLYKNLLKHAKFADFYSK